MTILVAYKMQERTVFISDFRVSFREANQVDAISKFLHFDNRLAFFTAGSVRMWQAAIDVINTIISNVDYQNVSDDDGPLFRALRSMTEQTPYMQNDPGLFGGFGIYVNTATNENVVFKIVGQAGHGLRIFQVPDGISVIGSGSYIPEIQNVLQQKMDIFVRNEDFLIRPTAEKLRSELKEILIKCGSSVFEKLGISPIFNISGLIGSSFQMFGEQLVGGRYVSGGTSRIYNFSFDRINGELVLRDNYTNAQHIVHDILTSPYDGSVGVEFDPEGLTEMFDPSCFVSGNNIYILSQWVEDATMERVVFKTSLFRYNQWMLANPNYIQIAQAIGQAESRHKNIYRMDLIVSPDNQDIFEQNIEENLMDDDWLSAYIENSNQLYKD